MIDLSKHLTLLAEPTRVRLLAALQEEELQVGELVRVLQLPQSTVSRHLKSLREAGWVKSRSEGSSSLFRANRTEVDDAASEVCRVVLSDFGQTLQHKEDQARLGAVLADRITDSRSFFGKLHGRWDALRDQLYGRDFWVPTLLGLLPDGLTVADLGCGTGEAVALIAPSVERVIGVDREPAMLQAAQVRCEGLANVDLRTGELDALPVADASVDAALAVLVLHHVDDPSAVLAEAARILRPGGRLVVLDLFAHDREEWAESMGHTHLGFSRDALDELASRAGLAVRANRGLPPAADASGPPLFVAVLGRS